MSTTIKCPNCSKHLDPLAIRMGGACPHCGMSRDALIDLSVRTINFLGYAIASLVVGAVLTVVVAVLSC